MAKLLIHVTTAPEDPTKAALSFLVAKTALAEGHEVNLFLAGESVRLLDAETLESLQGLGTGNLKEHYDAIVENGGQFYLSGMSAKARGYDESLIDGKPARFAMPDMLVKLLTESDRSLTY
ncbi:MAG: DsrE family protein [Gammaproteobacteria bacterium]|nr:DsrE family protein [Gammaproteobacteria bacterium]